MATIPPAMTIRMEPMLPDGKIALVRRGKIVWFGSLSEPWEDAVFDLLLVSPGDFARLEAKLNGLG